MVSRFIQIVILLSLLSGCAATQKEIVTVTEYVEVPVVKYKHPEFPRHFTDEIKPSNVGFIESENGLICMDQDNAQKLRYDLEIMSGKNKAYRKYFNEIELSD